MAGTDASAAAAAAAVAVAGVEATAPPPNRWRLTMSGGMWHSGGTAWVVGCV